MHHGSIKNASKIDWINLTFVEIMQIENQKQKEYCMRMRKDCLRKIISPLLVNLPLHTGFKFSNSDEYLSCKVMLNDLLKEYKKRNYSKEEIVDILNGKRVKKR